MSRTVGVLAVVALAGAGLAWGLARPHRAAAPPAVAGSVAVEGKAADAAAVPAASAGAAVGAARSSLPREARAAAAAGAKPAPEAGVARRDPPAPVADAFPPGVGGMVIARDPETGAYGPPTAEQLRALARSAPEAARLDELIEVHLPGGGVGIHVGNRFQDYSVVRVGSDGRKWYGCVHSDGLHGPACTDSLVAPKFEER